MGHLMAATALIGAGADVNLLNHTGRSALHIAERRVARRVGGARVKKEERKQVVAQLKAHGAR